MFNQLLKVGLFVTLGLWFKNRLRGLAYLVMVLLLTWLLHSEYLAYVERSGNTDFLEWSFLLKWLIVFTSIAAYFLFVERKLGKSQQALERRPSGTQAVIPVGDGFDFLRQKKELHSDADMLLKDPVKKQD